MPHIHIFLNGKLILPWPTACNPCKKSGKTMYIYTGRWIDLAVFERM